MNRKFRAVTRRLDAGASRRHLRLAVTVAGAGPGAGGADGQACRRPPQRPSRTWPPRRAWGDPDIQGMFNFSYVRASISSDAAAAAPVARQPSSWRRAVRLLAAARAAEEAAAKARGEDPAAGRGGRGGGGRGGGGRLAAGGGGGACDTAQAFVSDDVYQQRLAAYEKQQAAGDRFANALKEGDFATALGGTVDPNHPQRQTSLIMDPPDGRLPPLTAGRQPADDADEEQLGMVHGELETEALVWDTPEDFDVWDRCITRGLPASMFPYRYNNGMQILQAPGYVILNLEMIHEARIIPVDGRPRHHTRSSSSGSASRAAAGRVRTRWSSRPPTSRRARSMTNYGTPGAPAGTGSRRATA